MIPSIGRIVHYRLSKSDAAQITKRRRDANQSGVASQETGVVVHCGNDPREGDVYPLVVTRVWSYDQPAAEETLVNGQVLLDGNDTLWVTSVKQGDDLAQWSDPRGA